jgi:hypothetical protein
MHESLMTEAARTSETSVDNYFTRQYIPEDNSELHTRRRENLKSHTQYRCWYSIKLDFKCCKWVVIHLSHDKSSEGRNETLVT